MLRAPRRWRPLRLDGQPSCDYTSRAHATKKTIQRAGCEFPQNLAINTDIRVKKTELGDIDAVMAGDAT